MAAAAAVIAVDTCLWGGLLVQLIESGFGDGSGADQSHTAAHRRAPLASVSLPVRKETA